MKRRRLSSMTAKGSICMGKPQVGLSMLYCLSRSFRNMTAELNRTETKYVELVDEGFHTLSKRRVSQLREIGESNSLTYSIHAPFADINIASPSKPMRKAVEKRLEKSLAYASQLNASVWVFHPGLKTGITMFYPGMEWLQNLETTRFLLRTARSYGVKIAIENVPEPHPFVMTNAEHFVRFYSDIGEDIDMVLDIGHANINKQTDEFLTKFADIITHIHASDNKGDHDQHLGIGYGNVDWLKVVNLLKQIHYDKTVIVESVEHVQESVQRLKHLLS